MAARQIEKRGVWLPALMHVGQNVGLRHWAFKSPWVQRYLASALHYGLTGKQHGGPGLAFTGGLLTALLPEIGILHRAVTAAGRQGVKQLAGAGATALATRPGGYTDLVKNMAQLASAMPATSAELANLGRGVIKELPGIAIQGGAERTKGQRSAYWIGQALGNVGLTAIDPFTGFINMVKQVMASKLKPVQPVKKILEHKLLIEPGRTAYQMGLEGKKRNRLWEVVAPYLLNPVTAAVPQMTYAAGEVARKANIPGIARQGRVLAEAVEAKPIADLMQLAGG